MTLENIPPSIPENTPTPVHPKTTTGSAYRYVTGKTLNIKPGIGLEQKKDEVRADIALTFTHAFFCLVGFVIITVPIYNLLAPSAALQISMKDTLLVISSVVGGPFGFVLGYYFKGTEK